LNRTIEIMLDEDVLMSQGGLRSLSVKDKHYASEENYWRGASWLPINFMVLRAARKYYWDLDSTPHK
jgi:mannosyl-oligosaccharide glucosidase